jgi:hypothetical protein
VDKAGHAADAEDAFYNVDRGGVMVSTPSPVVATVGSAFSQTLTALGGTAPYTFTVTGSLPPGLTRSGAVISGTPTTAGTFSVTVTVTDKAAKKATSYVSVKVQPAFSVTTPTVVSISASGPSVLAAVGGQEPLTWQALTALPAGVMLLGPSLLTDGTLPLGEYPVQFKVTDDAGRSATKALTLGVYSAITVTGPTDTLSWTAGAPITPVSLSASGGRAGGYRWAFTSDAPPPAGIVIDGSTGTVSGTPAATGPFTIGVSATDTAGGVGLFYFNVQIN